MSRVTAAADAHDETWRNVSASLLFIPFYNGNGYAALCKQTESTGPENAVLFIVFATTQWQYSARVSFHKSYIY